MRAFLNKNKTMFIRYKEDGSKFPFTLRHGDRQIHMTAYEATGLMLFLSLNKRVMELWKGKEND